MVNVNKNVNIFSVNSNHHRTSGTRTYTRAMGQHSVFSQAGWHGAARGFNAYDTHTVNLNRYSRMREGLNNRWDNYEHYHHGPQGPQEQNPSLLETLMMALPLGKQIFDFGKDIAKTFNIGGGKKTGDVKGGNGANPRDSVPDPKSNIDFKNIKSFSDIDNLQKQNLTSLTNFNEGYQQASVEASVSETLANTDVQAGLALIDGCNLTTTPLALSEVKIDTTNPNFTEALKTIDTDISEINTYVETNIKGAQGKLSNVIGNLTTNVAELTNELAGMNESDANYASKKSALEAAKKDLANAEAAQAALTKVEGECTKSVKQLEAKKAEVQTAQENHNKLQDKKYNMAKEQDEKLGKVNAEIAKLNAEITKLGTPEAGSKDQKKLNELRAKLTSAYNESTALITSLKSVGSKITNSAGTEYTIKNLATNSQPAGGGGQPK